MMLRSVSLFIVLFGVVLFSMATGLHASRLRMTKEERRLLRRQNREAAREGGSTHRNFRNDDDIEKYLKVFGEDAMIWRCKNAVQPFWDGHPLPLVELYCETLGVLAAAEWHHNGKLIDNHEKRYKQTLVPHFARNNYFSKWLDFRLKIYNATTEDSGTFTFTAVTRKGVKKEHQVFVDISRKKKRKSQYLRSMKMKRRDYIRYYLFHNQQMNNEINPKNNVIKTGKNSYYMV